MRRSIEGDRHVTGYRAGVMFRAGNFWLTAMESFYSSRAQQHYRKMLI
jgi:hypothetical protein